MSSASKNEDFGLTDAFVTLSGGPSVPRMQCEIINEFDRLEALRPDWDRLWNLTSRQYIFSSFSWARAIWRAYGHQRSLCTSIVTFGGCVVLILPLASENGVLRFLASPHADVNEVLLHPEYGEAAFALALQSLQDSPISWNRCLLENIPENSSTCRFLTGLSQPWKGRTLVLERGACPTFILGSDSESNVRAVLGKAHLRQLRNRLNRQGRVVFRTIEARAEIEAHLPAFFDQHVRRWAIAGVRSAFSRPEPRSFFQALVEELDPGRALRFSVLELDGRPIAYHLGFFANGRFFYYKPTYDLDAADASPGQVLLAYVAHVEAFFGLPGEGSPLFSGVWRSEIRLISM